MTPKTSALDRSTNPVHLLSNMQSSTAEANRRGNFGQLLENTMQPQPTESTRTPNRDAERPSERQTPRSREKESRPAEAQSASRSDQGKEVGSRDAGPEANKANPSSDAERTDPAGNPQAHEEGESEDAETQDPAKLAVLAAVLAALRGNTETAETEEGALSSTRAAQGGAAVALSADAEGKNGGNRPGSAKNASAAAQLAATSSVSASAANEAAKPVATLRSTEAVTALASATLPSRNAAANAAAAENLTNMPSSAPVNAPRAELATLHKMLVPTPAGQRQWADDVANRVIWMAGRGEGRAELILTPPHLGKLGVSIQMNGDQTTAHFVAASAVARETLEHALPRLREALQQAGIMLGDASVSTSGDQQAHNGGEGARGGDKRAQPNEYGILPEAAEVPSNARWSQVGNNLVDIFA
ncbi:MAG TPA: flagellar hook-length control protein FliK [Azoarcus taiwanensis]|nr:flagellar hook-length control protein FliK [Azoarcus taiwanensis]